MPDPTHPYERPTDPAKRHSAALTDGPDRAGARSMLKAIGFTDEDLAKPIVGVGTTWIETMPCNYNHRRLAEAVKAGIRAAGGTPMEFNTISVSDGVTMGTEGMKASLVSREVVADSIELVARGHLFDGLVCVFGCDKTGPGLGDGAGPARHPRAGALLGHDLPRHPDAAERVDEPRRDGRHGVRGDRRVPGGQDQRSTSCTRSRAPPAPARAPAAASSRRTR